MSYMKLIVNGLKNVVTRASENVVVSSRILNVPSFRLMSVLSTSMLPSMSAKSPSLQAQASQWLKPMQVGIQPSRGRIVYSYRGGKPKTVSAVVGRFMRLYNGLWIRTRAGRHKKRWAKTLSHVARLQQHVFLNRTQSCMLDRMVNISYKLPKFYVNDPYAPYHRKSNLPDYRYRPPKFLP